ncbi:long-chain-fatty-acid--CoA ligase 4 [Exaiptasia diaphana]|uniref:long-chain-fatty-acid--CoA ligase n=1 Tax=Exaiptasia diaphana TaxID=2652724 RepID=A0A913YSV4_EXADI|nr:long-chain-fatty-acid--CoA ligase 4 [Exaiptasia diaphana]
MERSLVESVFLFSLNVAGWFWGVVSFVPWYYLTGRQNLVRRQKIQAKPTSPVPGAPYRDVEHFDALVTTLYKGITTMDQLFRRAVQLYAFRKCLGTREILQEVDEVQQNGRVFKKQVRGEYHWLTFAQVDDRARNLGNGLTALGQERKKNIVIFAGTRAEWMIALQSCFANSFPVVTIYATLGDDAVVHGINQTDVEFVITDAELLPKLAAIAHKLKNVRHIIYIGEISKSAMIDFPRNMKMTSMHDVEELGSRPENTLFLQFIFGKIRNLLGGRVRQMLSGGAPLSADTQSFMNVCFCCPVVQGYGLTETCSGGTICNSWDMTAGRVGPPIPSTEIKLVSWEEGGYTIRDKPHPRGEVVIGGANVTLGYFKNPKKTAEDFEVDRNGQRWFHTGDIGVFHDDGCLQIIDRKKDLVKLQAGEYVSLGKVEAALAQSQYSENVCAYADSLKTYAVCLVVPRPKQLKQLAASMSIPTEDWNALCSNAAITKAVLKDLQTVGKSAKLEKFEIPQKITLVAEQWTPESELVTAALKLKRNNITSFYHDTLQAMYN